MIVMLLGAVLIWHSLPIFAGNLNLRPFLARIMYTVVRIQRDLTIRSGSLMCINKMFHQIGSKSEILTFPFGFPFVHTC